jgi:hypothetical protein
MAKYQPTRSSLIKTIRQARLAASDYASELRFRHGVDSDDDYMMIGGGDWCMDLLDLEEDIDMYDELLDELSGK